MKSYLFIFTFTFQEYFFESNTFDLMTNRYDYDLLKKVIKDRHATNSGI